MPANNSSNPKLNEAPYLVSILTSYKVALACVLSAVLCLMVIFLVLRLDRADLSIPLNYIGDAIVFLTKAKGIVQGDWIRYNSRIGMPFGANWIDFPLNITLESLCMLILSFLSTNPGVLVNIQWLGGIAAASATMTYALLRLGIRPSIAICFGVVYALQPYGFYRGISHLHSMYYLVPLLALVAVEIALGVFYGNEQKSLRRTIRTIPLYLWLACIGIGLSYLYTAFFGCFVILIGTLLGFWKFRSRATLLVGTLAIGLICMTALLDMSPSVAFWLKHGTNPSMDFKYPAEAEIYGLKLRFLLTPIPDHPIKALSDIDAAFSRANFPYDTENKSTRLGTIGGIGFLMLLTISLAGGYLKAYQRGRKWQLLHICAALSLACVLLATVGGFGDFFNTFVVADIRCYNRISPFISFFSIVSVATVIQVVSEKYALQRGAKIGFFLLLCSIVVFAAVDQPVTSGFLPHGSREQIFRADADFVRQIESVLTHDASIFQLPNSEFPVEQLQERMFNNDQGRGYIHSSHSRWSWGAISGTTSAEWNRGVSTLAVPEMVHRLAHHGYRGVWIDSFGYKVGRGPQKALSEFLGVTELRSNDGRHSFFDLSEYINRMNTSERTMNEDELKRLHPVEVTFERGLYSVARSHSGIWSSGKHGRIVLINPLAVSRTVTVSILLRSGASSVQRIKIASDKGVEEVEVTKAQPYSRTVSLPSTASVPIELTCACNAFAFKGDSKVFYFGVQDFQITE